MWRLHFPSLVPGRPGMVLCAALGASPARPEAGVMGRRFAEVERRAREFFVATGPAEADAWVYPYGPTDTGARAAAEAARAAGKPLLFFHGGDDPTPTAVPWGTVYRESAFASRLAAHERIMPALCNDPLQLGLAIDPPGGPAPTVGFCGYVGRRAMLPVYRVLGRGEKSAGLAVRRQALAALRRTPGLRTHFMTRAAFWAGSLGLNRRRARAVAGRLRARLTGEPQPAAVPVIVDAAKQERAYREFVANVLASDYTLAPRGAGNYSYRFYETLAAGRVPILIDTDMRLPFDDQIAWDRHVVRVPGDEIESAGERVLTFHRALSADALRDLRAANRQLWETRLAPLVFFRHAIRRAVNEAGLDGGIEMPTGSRS